VFGISFFEIAVIAVIVLIVVGPKKLPSMLRTVGDWIGKLRRLTTEVRAQTGIDDILRNEGIDGGLTELRSILRGDVSGIGHGRYEPRPQAADPYPEPTALDPTREFPPEGADAAGAIADDLFDDGVEEAPAGVEPAESSAAAQAKG
jgi:sec-independent protein translocase protein TatB